MVITDLVCVKMVLKKDTLFIDWLLKHSYKTQTTYLISIIKMKIKPITVLTTLNGVLLNTIAIMVHALKEYHNKPKRNYVKRFINTHWMVSSLENGSQHYKYKER